MPLAPTRRWEGTAGGPDSQETTSDHKADSPRGKGWLMHRQHMIRAGAAALGTTLALAGAQLATAATVAPAAHATATAHAAAAARATAHGSAAAPKVTVRVQGRNRTLLPARTVRPGRGSVRRGGAPAGKCPDDSAQGALNVATHGHWRGKWYSTYDEYFITGILGDNETSKKYYWGLYVNGKLASKGACEVKLRTGDRLLFKVTKS